VTEPGLWPAGPASRLKHQVIHPLQKCLLNPPIKLLFAMGRRTALGCAYRLQ